MNRVLSDQSLASRSAVKSACISSNGVCEAGRSEGAGRVIEPRNSVVVVIGITALGSQGGKADGLSIPEGSSLGGVMAKSLGYHRGLRAGGSSRQGRSPAGESPAMSIARFRHVAIPQVMVGNRMAFAWCKRPGRPVLLGGLWWVQPGGLASMGA